MKTFKEKITQVVDHIFCDVCGKTCTDDFYNSHENATLEAIWGYKSQHDLEKYEIHLCESCFFDVINFMKEQRRKVLGSLNYPYDKDPLNGEGYDLR